MDYHEMGRRLRSYRQRAGLTQEQLAERADISATFLGHIERGTRIASLDTVMALCQALDVMPNDVLCPGAGMIPSDMPLSITISPRRLLQEIAALLRMQQNDE